MNGRELLAIGLASLMLVAVAPGASTAANEAIDAADEVVTPAAAQLPADTVRYGEAGAPGFAVKLETQNDTSALEDWANGSDSREILDEPTGANGTWVLIRAGAPETTGGFGTNTITVLGTSLDVPWYYRTGLESRSYVETVDVERNVEIAQPVSLRSRESYEKPDLPVRVELAGGLDVDDQGPDWLAFSNDTEERTLSEARTAMGDTNVSSGTNGTGVTAAVIDTGCNVLDDSLRGRLYGNGTAGSSLRIDNDSKSFLSNESVSTSAGNYSAVEDGNGHGSWVTSALASANSTSTGVAPDADILCLKALDAEGTGSSHDIAEAIRYAADNDADVASLSLGSPVYSQEIADAVDYATNRGTVVVVAVGNSRPQRSTAIASPADTPVDGVIAVGAANTSDSRTAVDETVPAYFSQHGPDNAVDFSDGVTADQQPDVVAPGMNISAGVATVDGTRTNRTLSGTSMATPLVAGAVAQSLEGHPDWQGNPSTAAGYVTNTTRTMPNATLAAAGQGYVAADKLNSTNTTGSQRYARTEEAKTRDEVWRATSDASGGLFARLAERLGV